MEKQMKIDLTELLVLIDAAYAASHIYGLGNLGCKYTPEQIISAINSVQQKMKTTVNVT
jgi:hypothetical protein